MSDPVNVEELEALARARLDKGVYDYYAGGAEDEQSVRGNREAFQRLRLKYRVLVDVSTVDRGDGPPRNAALPAGASRADGAPSARRSGGEIATARAAARPGTL